MMHHFKALSLTAKLKTHCLKSLQDRPKYNIGFRLLQHLRCITPYSFDRELILLP